VILSHCDRRSGAVAVATTAAAASCPAGIFARRGYTVDILASSEDAIYVSAVFELRLRLCTNS